MSLNATNDNGKTSRQLEDERMARVRAQHYVGARYRAGQDIVDVAKAVRLDIAAARAAGELPRGLKVRVKTSRFAGGRSLTLTIVGVPAGFVLASVARARQDLGFAAREPLACLQADDARALRAKLEALANAYNYDRSDLATDYHDSAFYLHVDYSHELWQASRDEVRAAVSAAYQAERS